MNNNQPHQGQPVLTGGVPVEDADAAIIAIHGRGASARSILQLAEAVGGDGWAYLAPQASRSTWYPYSFLEPTERNEPGLSSALQVIDELVTDLGEQGIPPECVVLLGFSQGACLASEYAARHAQRFGGVIAFSGGVIGAPGTPRDYDGSLDGTSVFIGCSDNDPHIPLERVKETTAVFNDLGADVDERIYPGMPHTVNEDELAAARELVASVLAE